MIRKSLGVLSAMFVGLIMAFCFLMFLLMLAGAWKGF